MSGGGRCGECIAVQRAQREVDAGWPWVARDRSSRAPGRTRAGHRAGCRDRGTQEFVFRVFSRLAGTRRAATRAGAPSWLTRVLASRPRATATPTATATASPGRARRPFGCRLPSRRVPHAGTLALLRLRQISHDPLCIPPPPDYQTSRQVYLRHKGCMMQPLHPQRIAICDPPPHSSASSLPPRLHCSFSGNVHPKFSLHKSDRAREEKKSGAQRERRRARLARVHRGLHREAGRGCRGTARRAPALASCGE